MKKVVALSLVLILCLSLLVSCGKPRNEKLLDTCFDITNYYTSLTKVVSNSYTSAHVNKFSVLGAELTDIAYKLSRDGSKMTDEELDKIAETLSDIEAQLKIIENDLSPESAPDITPESSSK